MTANPKQARIWNMGNIALFGAMLMSHGIHGKDKEFLKKLMYQALTPSYPTYETKKKKHANT